MQPGLQKAEQITGKLFFRVEQVSTHVAPHGLNIAPCTEHDSIENKEVNENKIALNCIIDKTYYIDM